MEHPERHPNNSNSAVDETSRPAPPPDDNAPSSPVQSDDELMYVGRYAAVSRYRQLGWRQSLADKKQLAHALDMGGQEAEDECCKGCIDLFKDKRLPRETHVLVLQTLATLSDPADAAEYLIMTREPLGMMD